MAETCSCIIHRCERKLVAQLPASTAAEKFWHRYRMIVQSSFQMMEGKFAMNR
jgi:hypothetical protein